ncbi:MAG: hypothetical protein V4732_10270 [Pseudomonadota bacterium]
MIQPTFPTPSSDTLKLALTAFDATNLATENLNHIATLFKAIQDTAQQQASTHIAALAGIGRFLADEYYALCEDKNLQLDQHIARFQALDTLD